MDEQQTAEADLAFEPTGDPAVDEVLAMVSALSQSPVEQHVSVFETAHEQLRRALDAQPDT